MRVPKVIAAAIILLPFLRAQSTTAGYFAPRPINVAPGQVIALFVLLPNKPAANRVTATAPLPTTLGGFTIALRQSLVSDPIAVPIQTVADGTTCSVVAPTQCDSFSMVTVQVPFG